MLEILDNGRKYHTGEFDVIRSNNGFGFQGPTSGFLCMSTEIEKEPTSGLVFKFSSLKPSREGEMH